MEQEKLLENAISYAREIGKMNTHILQRRFKVGFLKAEQIITQMKSKGVFDASTGMVKRTIK